MKISVGIATVGRPDIVQRIVSLLAEQTRKPDNVILCPARPADLGDTARLEPGCPVEIVEGGVGLPRQRNAIMRACQSDILLFIDDDFLLRPDYIANMEALMATQPDIALLTGLVVADGALGPGLSVDEGLRKIAEPAVMADFDLRPTYGGYGCNMAFRMDLARRQKLHFDEDLPLYAWLEDIDFSRQLAPYGKIMRSARMQGVHLGSKSGRTSGVKLGYSQVVNPIYLIRKGTVSRSFGMRYVRRNILSNIVRSVSPEAWIDRRGRLKGNLMGVWDLVTGRARPSRILDF